MGQQNIIELNGKRYDAVTGAFLGDTKGGQPHRPSNGRAVDGFIRTKRPAAQTTPVKPAAPAPAKTVVTTPSKTVKKPGVNRTRVKPLQPHTPEHAKTLMRRAVHKPHTNIKPAIKPQAPTELMAAPLKSITTPLEKKLSVKQVNPARMARAKATPRSQHVQRFNQAALPAPSAHPAIGASHPVARPVARPAARPGTYLDLRRQAAQQSSAAVVPVQPKVKEPVDIFEAAIAHARSHEQPVHKAKRKHTKLASMLAGVGAFLILGGFIAYLNVPNIEVHVASLQAGFHAQLPGYTPTGYAMDGGVHAKNNTVAIHFTSGDSSYTVTQQPSDWDSQTLLDNYVAFSGSSHKTIQSHGRTIFIYDGTNATWVNGGVRYDVTGSASLTSDELVSLATSM